MRWKQINWLIDLLTDWLITLFFCPNLFWSILIKCFQTIPENCDLTLQYPVYLLYYETFKLKDLNIEWSPHNRHHLAGVCILEYILYNNHWKYSSLEQNKHTIPAAGYIFFRKCEFLPYLFSHIVKFLPHFMYTFLLSPP